PSPERGPAGSSRLGEELCADRGQQHVLVPHPSGRAQDAGPARGRGAVRGHGAPCEHLQGAGEAEAPRHAQGDEARLEEGDRPVEARRLDRDLHRSSGLMPIRRYKPTSPGRRFMTVSTFEEVTKSKPDKALTTKLSKKGGRNNSGRITTRHQGGGHKRRVALTGRATVGQVGNVDHENVTGGKAGRARWQGKRPTVRGSAMNPVDHPHGGGEGKSKGGRHPVTPWGVPTLGKRTRRKHKESDKLIVRGRRRGKEGRR